MEPNNRYQPQEIEPKWQKIWDETQAYRTTDDFANPKKIYVMDMFPFPSGAGLHVGHPEGYTATDIYARKKRMEGYNVLYPMGWDAFGLPAENYAIKTGRHPSEITKENIATFKRQIKSLGLSYDWEREIATTDTEYYKWTQWIFLQIWGSWYDPKKKKARPISELPIPASLKGKARQEYIDDHRLAYEAEASINWCESCKTGISNEEVVNGKCERCGNEVTRRTLRQWYMRITAYAERLLDELVLLKWPNGIIEMQRNWIGKSEGAEVHFGLTGTKKNLTVFTTRPDTLYGATYCVLSPEHSLLKELAPKIKNLKELEKYQAAAQKKSDMERTELNKDKTGVVLEGVEAINPLTKEKIPLFVADYVLASYGTGAIMAVPAHDERDYEFAKKFSLPIRQVVAPVFGTPDSESKRRDGAIIVLKNKENKILVLKTDEGNYVLPSGGYFEKEDHLVAAVRELREETGYHKIKLVSDLGEIEQHYTTPTRKKNRKRRGHGFFFLLEDDARLPGNEAENGDFEILWFDQEEAYELIRKSDFKTGEHYFLEQIMPGAKRCFIGEGIAINSEKIEELPTKEAKEMVIKILEKEKLGEKTVNYKFRDWLFSRQRYWGEPFPLVHCEKCGTVAIPESELPLLLPEVKKYEPTGTGESPLAGMKEWVETSCPVCGGKAKRETNTMPQWAGSCWYQLRYIDPRNKKALAGKKALDYWMKPHGVDLYVGGAEHAVLHLLYARFWHKVLNDLKVVPGKEPYYELRNQGLILGEDGEKMSKSRGNVINPDDTIKKYGADTLRMYEMFMGPFEAVKPWNTKGTEGVYRFLQKVWRLCERPGEEKMSADLTRLVHQTIAKVSSDIDSFNFNTAISQMMILVNEMQKNERVPREALGKLLFCLSPFAPHIAEECWEQLGHKTSIFKEKWPEYDATLAKNEEIELVLQVNGKVRAKVQAPAEITQTDAIILAKENVRVKEYLAGKEIMKEIYVPGRLVNFVVR